MDTCENHGNRTREFRNGIGYAVPSADQVEVLRRAVRYLLAIEQVQGKWRELNLTDAQKGQLRERNATEKSAAESALLKLYGEVWLPRPDSGSLSLEAVSIGGRPLQTTLDEKKRAQIHQRLMELLETVQRKVFGSVAPGKIVELFKLNESAAPERGIPTGIVVAGFFSFLGFPRLLSNEVVRKSIARGVETGLFGYTTGRPVLGEDGRYQVDRSRIAFERSVADDEIDLDSGFLMLPKAIPREADRTGGAPSEGRPVTYVTETGGGAGSSREDTGPVVVEPGEVEEESEVAFTFTANREKLFNAWNALANLADVAGEVSITARAKPKGEYDKSTMEYGVLEPLRELGLINEG